MRTLYHAYSEEHGECEAMFSESGDLLGIWSCNDATWRNEYFRDFMEALGFEVKSAPPELVDKLEATAKDYWG